MRTTSTRWTTRTAVSRARARKAVAAVAAAWMAAGAAASADPGPREVVQTTVDQVPGVLREKELPKDQRRQRLEEIVYARFDFTTMSRLVLARHWKSFSGAQQEEFLREYKRYLANSYGARLDRYSGEQVEILSERKEPRGDVTVQTRIVGGEFDGAFIDYRLRSRQGPWLVIDVIIEGVSLVSNYRDQFKEVLSQGGPEHLLERLREKNASGEIDAAV